MATAARTNGRDAWGKGVPLLDHERAPLHAAGGQARSVGVHRNTGGSVVFLGGGGDTTRAKKLQHNMPSYKLDGVT